MIKLPVIALYLILIVGLSGCQKDHQDAQPQFLATSLLIQLLLVYAQNKKKGMKKVAYEALTVLLFIKPAVDAFRVASGAETEVGSTMDPLLELTGTKVIEMFAESIPAAILQTYAFLISETKNRGALMSIFISSCTTHACV